MKYIFLQNNIVHEIIPESNPAFPAVPIDKRYPPHFLAQCVMVADPIPVEQNWIYDPLTGQLAEPEPILSPIPEEVTT